MVGRGADLAGDAGATGDAGPAGDVGATGDAVPAHGTGAVGVAGPGLRVDVSCMVNGTFSFPDIASRGFDARVDDPMIGHTIPEPRASARAVLRMVIVSRFS